MLQKKIERRCCPYHARILTHALPSLPPSFLIMFSILQQVKEVQTLEETEAALNEAGGKLVVLDFTATW